MQCRGFNSERENLGLCAIRDRLRCRKGSLIVIVHIPVTLHMEGVLWTSGAGERWMKWESVPCSEPQFPCKSKDRSKYNCRLYYLLLVPLHS